MNRGHVYCMVVCVAVTCAVFCTRTMEVPIAHDEVPSLITLPQEILGQILFEAISINDFDFPAYVDHHWEIRFKRCSDQAATTTVIREVAGLKRMIVLLDAIRNVMSVNKAFRQAVSHIMIQNQIAHALQEKDVSYYPTKIIEKYVSYKIAEYPIVATLMETIGSKQLMQYTQVNVYEEDKRLFLEHHIGCQYCSNLEHVMRCDPDHLKLFSNMALMVSPGILNERSKACMKLLFSYGVDIDVYDALLKQAVELNIRRDINNMHFIRLLLQHKGIVYANDCCTGAFLEAVAKEKKEITELYFQYMQKTC